MLRNVSFLQTHPVLNQDFISGKGELVKTLDEARQKVLDEGELT